MMSKMMSDVKAALELLKVKRSQSVIRRDQDGGDGRAPLRDLFTKQVAVAPDEASS